MAKRRVTEKITIQRDDGSTIGAERKAHKRHDHIAIQWRDAANKPLHQPLLIPVEEAPEYLEAFRAFAERIRSES